VNRNSTLLYNIKPSNTCSNMSFGTRFAFPYDNVPLNSTSLPKNAAFSLVPRLFAIRRFHCNHKTTVLHTQSVFVCSLEGPRCSNNFKLASFSHSSETKICCKQGEYSLPPSAGDVIIVCGFSNTNAYIFLVIVYIIYILIIVYIIYFSSSCTSFTTCSHHCVCNTCL
jgi:hypothetical protein